MGDHSHLIDDPDLGLTFQSDKYDWCPPGFFALKFADWNAREAIRGYARSVERSDPDLARDLVTACEVAEAG